MQTRNAVIVFRGHWMAASEIGRKLDECHKVPNLVTSPGDGPSFVEVLPQYAARARKHVQRIGYPVCPVCEGTGYPTLKRARPGVPIAKGLQCGACGGYTSAPEDL